MRRKLIAGLLTALSVTMVCPAAYASTEHYTDSSVVSAIQNIVRARSSRNTLLLVTSAVRLVKASTTTANNRCRLIS